MKVQALSRGILLFLTVSIAAFSGCSGAPARPPSAEAPRPPAQSPGLPSAGPRVPGRTPPSAFPAGLRPSEVAGTRFIRVLLAEDPGEVVFSAEAIRAWDAGGRLVAEGQGSVALSAVGERIRFGGGKLLGDSIDVAGVPELRVAGRMAGGRVRVLARRGRILAVAAVPLETYVAAVVSREAPRRFHPEALAAQAVVVRTYAIGSSRSPRDPAYDVVGSVEDQVFDGVDDISPVFREAAEATRGLTARYRGELARTVFHSTCGGRTESAADAWGKDVPYLRAVPCEDCSESPAYRWEYRMSAAEGRRLAEVLGVRPGKELRFFVAGRTATGRAIRVGISSGGVSRDAKAAEFRKAAGYAKVRSLKFEIASAADGWVFSGQGYGHGVGMCQFGANGMANAGRGYREILARYYPGVEVAGEAP